MTKPPDGWEWLNLAYEIKKTDRQWSKACRAWVEPMWYLIGQPRTADFWIIRRLPTKPKPKKKKSGTVKPRSK